MTDQFFLRLSESLDRVTVARLNAAGQLLGREEAMALGAVASRSEGAPVTVLLPAQEIVSCVATLPEASSARLRQMLPFSLEDEFAGDVDDLQFALGQRIDSGEFAVSVIARARIDHWLGILGAAGIVPRRICSEADGVADTPGVTTLFLDGRMVIGRRPGRAPFTFAELTLAEVWTLLQSEHEDAADLNDVVLFVDSETLRERGDEIDAWRAGVARVDLKELADGILPRLAATLVFREPPNLLQGRYAPRSNYAALLRPWRAAAAFVLAVIAVAVLGQAAEAWKLKRDDNQLLAEIDAICTGSYAIPDQGRCLREMQQRLAGSSQSEGSSGEGFLQTVAAIAGASGDATRIEGINFAEDVLRLDVIVPSVAFVDTFREGMSRAGAFDVRVVSSAAEGDSYKTRLQIVRVNP